MIKNFRPKTCAFDCEWVPCAETARRLLKLAPDTTEADAFEAIWDYSRKAGDDTPQPFIKLTQVATFRVADV